MVENNKTSQRNLLGVARRMRSGMSTTKPWDSDGSVFSVASARSGILSACSKIANRIRSKNTPRTAFLKLCRGRNFNEIIRILNDESHDFKTWFRNCPGKRGQTVLHVLLEYQPPVKVVHLLVKRLRQTHPHKKPEICQDKDGKTPLHVAVERMCNPNVVALLLKEKSNPAAVPDRQGQYPLHSVCSNQSRLIRATVSKRDIDKSLEETIQVVSFLAMAYPDAVYKPDAFCKTPEDMAVERKADKRILDSMAYATDIQKQMYSKKADTCGGSQSLTCASTDASERNVVPDEIVCSNFDFEDDDVSTLGWADITRPKQRNRALPTKVTLSSHDFKKSSPQAEMQKCYFL